MADALAGIGGPQTSPFAHLSPPGSPAREKAAAQVAKAIIAAGKKARGEA